MRHVRTLQPLFYLPESFEPLPPEVRRPNRIIMLVLSTTTRVLVPFAKKISQSSLRLVLDVTCLPEQWRFEERHGVEPVHAWH